MIQLGPITLPARLIWVNEFEEPEVAISDGMTIGGRYIYNSARKPISGRLIQLRTDSRYVYHSVTRAELQQLTELYHAGLAVVFQYDTFTANVLIHSVSGAPRIEHTSTDADELKYSLQIDLRTV